MQDMPVHAWIERKEGLNHVSSRESKTGVARR